MYGFIAADPNHQRLPTGRPAHRAAARTDSRPRSTSTRAWLLLVLVLAAALTVAGGTPAAPTEHATVPGHGGGTPSVRELTTFAEAGCASGCGSGSTVGPDRAIYVTDGPGGRVLRVDPRTGATTTFASGLPRAIPDVGIGGAIDVVFVHGTAYVMVTLVGPEFGQPEVIAGVYRIDGQGTPTAIANVGAWSTAHPPETDFFIASGVQYALERDHHGLLISDGHHNRVLRVSRAGDISELRAFDNVVPTGLDTHQGRIYMAQAGPIPHHPAAGRVIRFSPESSTQVVAGGAPLLVDVERTRDGRLLALSQGVWDLPPTPENEGKPAAPDTGRILMANRHGGLVPLVEGLDQPTSFEVVGDTAFVITLTGKVLKIDHLARTGRSHAPAASSPGGR